MDDELLQRVMHLWDTGEDGKLIELAAASWPEASTAPLTSTIAELCRYARNAARRRAGPEDFAQFRLWDARAMVAAVMTGARDTAAGLLLGPFFALTEGNHHCAARAIWGEVLRLVPPDHPRGDLFHRLYYEKLAFSFTKDGRFSEARDAYHEALRFCGKDPRGALKVQGGAAIAAYLALRGRPEAEVAQLATPLLQELQGIRDEARASGFVDVAEAAEANARLMETRPRQFEPWFPFEVT